MAFDFEYPYMRNFGGDGLHEDPDTFDLGHEGESAGALESLTDRIAGDATFDGNAFRVCYSGADCKVQFTSALTTPEEAALDAHVAAQRIQADWNVLADLKRIKSAEIDVRTAELILDGFTYTSKVFPLTQQDQNYQNGLRVRIVKARLADEIDTGESTYESDLEAALFPITFDSIDNSDKVVITTIISFEVFHDVAVDKVQTHENSGTALKDSVRAAANKAAVDAVVDSR